MSENLSVCAIVQARMGSSRYPGKVLAPLRGVPILGHVINRVREFQENISIIVATSDRESDLPLVAYSKELGVEVIRGSEDDVVSRILKSVMRRRYQYFYRICADSPLLDAALLQEAYTIAQGGDWDLVTNVHPRTFPRGMSVELLKTDTFIVAADYMSSDREREHVTLHYYANPQAYRIFNISLDVSCGGVSYAVDTVDDLRRLEDELQGRRAPLRYCRRTRSLI